MRASRNRNHVAPRRRCLNPPLLLAVALLLPALAQAQQAGTDGAAATLPPALVATASHAIDADAARLTALYKDIHQHPELGFMETRTAGIVAKQLRALGFEVTTGVGRTGVVGVLRNGPGPVVVYRADMDANAVAEASGLPWASHVRATRADGQDVPVAHLCGHDVHVVWMLGMASAMAGMKRGWSGTLILIAQPAEELSEGARAMVDDGLWTRLALPRPDYFVGQHTAVFPTGMIVSSGGAKMAGTDQIDILFKGVGGHGSAPQTTRDPVIMAAYAVTFFQAIVSRTISPQQTAVLTVGSIQAGSDSNVIPETALVKVNLRWYDSAVRDRMVRGVTSISEGIARIYGMPESEMPVITMRGASTPLYNDEPLAARLAAAMAPLLGADHVVEQLPQSTGSEDMHLLKGPWRTVPLNLMLVGIADPARYREAVAKTGAPPYANHSPDFVVDLNAVPLGAKTATVAMLELLHH